MASLGLGGKVLVNKGEVRDSVRKEREEGS